MSNDQTIDAQEIVRYPWHEQALLHVAHQIKEQRMPHAVLFRRRPYFYDSQLGYQLARLFLCDTSDGCGHCQHCHLMKDGSHPNLLMLDVFSDKVGIDDVRSLEQQMWQTAVFDKPKIAFIHGVDVLSRAAQNALLKTLEEPPKNTFFILSVENVSQVLQTIMSRVQLIQHERHTDEMVFDWVQAFAERQNMRCSGDELNTICEWAHYAPERAVVLLNSTDEISALQQEKKRVADFIAGKISANELVVSMDEKDWVPQLSRYVGYIDRLIRHLFEQSTREQATRPKQHSEQSGQSTIATWQGVPMTSLYRLRDVLLELSYLSSRNVNMTLQLKSTLSDWHNRRKECGFGVSDE